MKNTSTHPVTIEGWNQLKEIAKCGPQELRRWAWVFPPVNARRESVEITPPRIETEFKNKLGMLQVHYTADESDMEEIAKRLTPREFADFRKALRNQLTGMRTLIEGASKVTCQATGRPGAIHFADDCGVVLTLHPDMICALGLRPRKERA